MAKSKTKPLNLSEDEIIKALQKKYGTMINSASFITDRQKHIIKVSPAFDIGFSGGIPEGNIVNLSGKQKSGKTSLALKIAAEAQKKENGSRQVIFGDVEERLEKLQLEGTLGLEVKDIITVKSAKQNILTAEEHLDILEGLMKDFENFVCIVDSVSALAPESEITAPTTGQIRATTPKMMKHWLKKVKSYVKVNNGILILIHHLISNTSGYGKAYYEDGGNYAQYQSDIKAVCKSSKSRTTPDGKVVGKDMEWFVEWSALGEEKNINSFLTYGIGIDEAYEILHLGIELGLIEKSGSWFAIPGHMEKSVQGQDALYQYLLGHKEVVEDLRGQILGILL